MYLKNLALLGFKSFADKTSLSFLPGVTAIVGPNGCGKSNISDAIRWVLGEQSAKALRGGEMADVIFNGTDQRKPMSMAEISLTVGDVDSENLRAAGVEMSYNEVTLTRRVFRDGASEYFINRTPCRLKDIQQLFMGTGVGRTSYSIMAQGNITQLLSSKPEDRRMVFEEAAGITKFKSQKRESLRKLEYTEQNLLRVADLIREVKRQIGSLQRQAGKARRYKQLLVELQYLDTQLARHHFDVLQSEIQRLQSSIDSLRSELEACSQTVLNGEDQIAQLRSSLSDLEEEIHRLESQGHELKSHMDRQDGRIQFNEERLRELEQQNATALNDIAQSEERRSAANQELAAVTDRLSVSNTTFSQHRNALADRERALRSVEEQMTSQQASFRQSQADAFAAAQQLTRVRNEINALDLQKQGNIARLEKLSAEKSQLEEERIRLELRLQEFAAKVQAEKQHAQTSRGTVEDRQRRLREMDQELRQTTRELDELLQQQAEKRSRLSVLEQLQSDYEGFGEGPLAVLKGAQKVLGSLTDQIRVPDEYVHAIEAALGHHLQLVLAEHPEAAQGILGELSTSQKGRASVAALSLLSEAAEPAMAFAELSPPPSASSEGADPVHGNGHAGVPGIPALSVIQSGDSVQPLLRRLLSRTRIVDDLSAATSAWKTSRGGMDFVTRRGELLDRQGIYTGGAGHHAGNGTASVLARKNQIAGLHSLVAHLQERVQAGSQRKGALQGEQAALQASLQEAQTELRTQEVAIATQEGEYNALQSSLRTLHQKIDTVVYEIQSLAAQEQDGRQKREGLAGQLGDLESRERALQQRLNEITSAVEALRQRRDEENLALTESKVALAAEEQVQASLRQQQRALQSRIGELTQLIEQRRSETIQCLNRRSQAQSEIEEARRKRESLAREREETNALIADWLEQKRRLDADIASREEALREQRRRLSEQQQQRSGLEVELAQKDMACQNLCQRVQEKYQVKLQEIRSECITITIANEGPPRVQTLTPEEMAASGFATDWAAVEQQVAALQQRIDEMGPVNLVAIEEYEETEQRYQFLSTQHDDLVKAKQQLLDVINRINVQTREMFLETFHQIRDNFRLLFAEVFGGGKADLHLVDEGDVLESGIEIVARPPGKQLQSISLLSGGEQTMTAVSLLFAIYQVKPSPFCVLDELDAPLDDANISRFVRILQRFLQHSQFILITHNKRTIGMANVLYGVTMQEHGISKIVSVKLHKAEEDPNQEAKPLVPPPDSAIEEEEDKLRAREETFDVVMAK